LHFLDVTRAFIPNRLFERSICATHAAILTVGIKRALGGIAAQLAAGAAGV
jgi:hypothetical protein